MAELQLQMTGRNAGLLRRFRIMVDGVEVARLKQGEGVSVTLDAGPHRLTASLDWHVGEPFDLELSDDQRTSVAIEYMWLITDKWLNPKHPFKYKTT